MPDRLQVVVVLVYFSRILKGNEYAITCTFLSLSNYRLV